jgi:S1-C subfamily serine protease
VASGSPADRAGLERGDVITAIGGKRVTSSADAVEAIDSHSPGDELGISLQRGGQAKSATVTLGERPS